MNLYRKRPIVIEAAQWTGENGQELVEWSKGKINRWGVDEDGAPYEVREIIVATLEGVMRASIGDWIIKGVQGEFYPCKPDIFEATYDLEIP
ncbi:hypothetical protein LCGC14_2611420 [marine sediment metagenome]|uniref:Phage protein n=1 Tax=marine sediment metagenome TaxID=412755 RepID=A0A0F9CGU5_9ZZZZ